jgi:hypothetical protein
MCHGKVAKNSTLHVKAKAVRCSKERFDFMLFKISCGSIVIGACWATVDVPGNGVWASTDTTIGIFGDVAMTCTKR